VRRALVISLALVLLVAGYVAADVYDLVPGILTRAPVSSAAASPTRTPTPAATAAGATAPATPGAPASGTPTSAPDDPLASLDPAAAAPTLAGLAAALRPLVADPALGTSVGLVVRDGLTGRVLYTRGATTPRTPASTLKLLSAAAVWTSLDPAATMATKVVRGVSPRTVILVAGGDTLLARGRGNPQAVAGRAGLRDLATQVAGRLRAAGTDAVTLRVDLGYAPGPQYPSSWRMADVRAGYTQGVEVAGAFVKALAAEGIAARIAATNPYAAHARADAAELGTVASAPYADVLALALDTSDNALMDNLARQAAVAAGQAGTQEGVSAFVGSALAGLGIDTHGLVLADASGLGAGSTATVRALGQVLALGASGHDPALQATLASLPVAGLTGTLADRFAGPATRAVAGIPRAKTGTLTGTSALAGTTVDTDGRLLLFAVIADAVPPAGTDDARDALDRLVTGLTGCGCR
jgi:D-alanyl-D-alanine carboxypeptidase/D-alanyl-D-alanine-endopeptidase (penicillin-binding protein 4)